MSAHTPGTFEHPSDAVLFAAWQKFGWVVGPDTGRRWTVTRNTPNGMGEDYSEEEITRDCRPHHVRTALLVAYNALSPRERASVEVHGSRRAPSPASETATPEPSVTTDAETVKLDKHERQELEFRFGESVAKALNQAWSDYTADTGCFPSCLSVSRSRKGIYVEADFRLSNFALFTAGWLLCNHPELIPALRSAPTPESSPAVDAGTTEARIDASELLDIADAVEKHSREAGDDLDRIGDRLRSLANEKVPASPAVDDETPKLLAQVAKAAAAFCAELQEDGEGVPQPELRALHAALDAVDLAKLEADWLTHLAVCYRCNEDHRDPCDIGARIRAEMDALDERIDSAAARRSPDSAPEANNA